MKTIKALKRTLAFVLTLTMLLSGVDSFSLTSYAEEYAGSDISANTPAADYIVEPAVSADEGEPDTGADVSDDTPVTDISTGEVDASYSDDYVVINVDEPVSFDVSLNDLSSNDPGNLPRLRSGDDKPANIVVYGDILQENGECLREEIASCDTFEEAQTATMNFYNSKIEEDANYFKLQENNSIRRIWWYVYGDIEIKKNGNNVLNNEEISSVLDIYLSAYMDGDERVYGNIYVENGASVDTCATFKNTSENAEEKDGVRYWGESDGSDGNRLILGAGSTFRLYASEIREYPESSYIWSVEDPTESATLIVGKNGTASSRLIVLHIGTPEKKIRKIICESGKNAAGRLNAWMGPAESKGIYPSDESLLNSFPDVVTLYAHRVEINGSFEIIDRSIYTYRGQLGIYGDAVVDSMLIGGELLSNEGSTISITDLIGSMGSGQIALRGDGDVIISGSMDIVGQNVVNDNGIRPAAFNVTGYGGNIYLPKDVTTHEYSYETTNGENKSNFSSCLNFQAWEMADDGRSSHLTDYKLGQTIFYIESSDEVSAESLAQKITVYGTGGTKTFKYESTKELNGKTYHKAVLEGKSFWYAYADENGEFPEYTPEHTGLTKWQTEYEDLTGIIEAISTAEFEQPGNVKVYIPIKGSVSLKGSGSTVSIGAEGSRVTDIEFEGNNRYIGDYDEDKSSQVKLGNSSLTGDDTYLLNLYANVTFNKVFVYTSAGKELEINAGNHDVTLADSSIWGYRTEYTLGNGFSKITAKTLSIICSRKNWHTAGILDVSKLVLSAVRLDAYDEGESVVIKDGMDAEFRMGANITCLGGGRLGTVTVVNDPGFDEDDYGFYHLIDGSTQNDTGLGFSIDKLIVEDGSRCRLSFTPKRYEDEDGVKNSFYCTGIKEIVVGKNAQFSTVSEGEGIALEKLTVKEGGRFCAYSVKVTGDTFLYGDSEIYCADFWIEENAVKGSEFNTITLVKGDVSEAGRRTARITRLDWSVPIKIINGIKSDSSAEEIGLKLRYEDYSRNLLGMLDSSFVPLKFLYTDAEATPAEDMAYISVDTGSDATQTLEVIKSDDAEPPYEAVFIAKPVGVGIYAAQKGDSFEKARLIESCNSYDEAISFINSYGNANMQYYVVLREDVDLKHALTFPKVGAGFGVVGASQEQFSVYVTGNITLPINFTLQNITLSTFQENATLNLNGKDLLLDNSGIYSVYDNYVKIAGTAGNLSVVNKTVTLAKGDVSLKSLRVENASLYMDGKLTVSGDVKVKSGNVVGINGNSRISKNLYMEKACLRVNGGTVEVLGNCYGYLSYIQPRYKNEAAYGYKNDYMSWIINHLESEKDASTVNFTVKGNTYIEKTGILVTGNVSLGTVYSGKNNDVYYGVDKNNTFTVKTVIGSKFEGTEGYGVNEGGVFVGSVDFEWVSKINAGECRDSSYNIIGENCSDSFSSDKLYRVVALENAISVRRAYIEKDYYEKDDFESYEIGGDALGTSNKLAQLYKGKALENIAIVSTSDASAKFIVGRKLESNLNSTVSIYSLKASGNTLVIDDTVTLPVVLTNSAERLIGRFDTLDEAFKRINALKNSAEAYVITVGDDSERTKKITDPEKNFEIPSYASEITIKGTGSTTLMYKDSITLKTNVTFEDVSFRPSVAAEVCTKLTLNGYRLKFMDCKDIGFNSVKGSKKSALEIKNTVFEEDTVEVLGDITGLDELCLDNVIFRLYGKATVGKLVVFNGTGNNVVRLDVPLNVGKAKVTKADNGTLKGEFNFTPNFTVSGAIENRGGADDVFTVLPYVGVQNVNNYVEDLYTEAKGEALVDGDTADWDEYVENGLPLIIAPKAEVSYSELKLDTIDNVGLYNNTPATGILIKKYSGNNAFLCYSSADKVSYTLNVGETRIADFITWSELVKFVNAVANKRDYTVVFNGRDVAEALTMPTAKNINSLYVKGATGTPSWKYTGAKISLTCPTTLENINLEGPDTTGLLTVSLAAASDLTISGKVTFGGRPVVIDGGKKAGLVLASGAKMANSEVSADYDIALGGTIKNMNKVTLGGAKVKLTSYTVSKKDTAPEFSVTDLTVDGEIIDVTGGKIVLTTLKADDAARLIAKEITVSGVTTVNTDNLYFGGYNAGSLKLNGNVTVNGNYTIKVDAYKDGKSIVDESLKGTAAVGPDTFVATTKATVTASLFKAAYVDGSGNVQTSVYDGTVDKAFFLMKKGNNIQGFNGKNVKAALYAGINDSNLSAVTGTDLYGYFVTYDDAVAFMNDKTKDYYLEINENTASDTAPLKKISIPATGKAKSVTIFSKDGDKLYYGAAPSFANNVTLVNLELAPVNKGKATAYAITVTGNNKLTLKNVKTEGAITNLTAPYLEIVNLKEVEDSEHPGTMLNGTKLMGTKLTVSKKLKSVNSMIDFTGAIALTDVEVTGDNDLTVVYTRVTDTKGNDKGSNLNIKGDITGSIVLGGRINLVMKVATDADVAKNYTLTKEEARKITVATGKVLFNAKNMTSMQMASFFVRKGDSDCDLSDYLHENGVKTKDLVKANGAFYMVGTKTGDAGENYVMLSPTGAFPTVYLDFAQAVKAINDTNNPQGVYEIQFGNISDPIVTDTIAYSKLSLPADNKAKSLVIMGTSIKFSSADAVTAYGNIEFKGIELIPVVAKDGTTPAKANGTINLKVNSKTKESHLKLTHGAVIKKSVNSISGDKNYTVITISGSNDVSCTNKLSNIKLLELNGTTIEVANASAIGKVSFLGTNPNFYTFGTSSIGNIEVASGTEVEISTALKVDNKGNKSALFTVTGTVENHSDDPIQVAIYASSRTVLPEKAEDRAAMEQTYLDETKGVPILIAKKADAAQFIPSTLFGNGEEIVQYKNLKSEVIADVIDNMMVEITAASKPGLKTYAQSWSDAVSIIDNAAAKEDYTFKLLKAQINAGKNGAIGPMVTPKAASAASITVNSGASSAYELSYTGALNPTCNITFDKVKLQEYTKSGTIYKPVADYASKINATSAVKLGLTKNTVNGSAGNLTFNSITVSKGTLWLKDDTSIGANGTINVAKLLIDGNAEIIPAASKDKKYPKQTYGTIETTVSNSEAAVLSLTNGFTKVAPATAASQISITGKVAPNVELELSLKNAQTDIAGKKLVANPTGDGYEAMSAGYISAFLEYKSTAKAPATKTSVLNAPFLDAGNLTVEGLDRAFDFYKISGNFYAVAKENGVPKIEPVVTLETDVNPDNDDDPDNDTWELSSDFLTWEAAVTELNKVTNNTYKYRLTLLSDIGPVYGGEKPYKVGNEVHYGYGITSVDRNTLPMPAKVNDLTVEGNGKNFVFTGTSMSIDSNIVFNSVAFISLAKITYTGMEEGWEDGKMYKVSNYFFDSTGKMKLSIAKGRTVTIKDYRGDERVSFKKPDGTIGSAGISTHYFASVTGTTGSKLVLDNTLLRINGKISGLDVLELRNGSEVYSARNIVPGLTVNNLIVSNSSVTLYKGAVSVKTATLAYAPINCDTFTANEVNIEGDADDINGIFAGYGDKGSVNIKKLNVNSNAEIYIEGHMTAKNVTQITINGLTFAEGCGNNKIFIGLQYAKSDLYVAFYNGQTVINCSASVPVTAFTLVTDDEGSKGGHACGEQGVDWKFERGAGNKNIVFRTIAN